MSGIGAKSKSSPKASMEMFIVKADGTRISFGTVTNRPIIKIFEEWYRNYKIKKYVRSMGS